MGKFDSLLKTKSRKRTFNYNFAKLYKHDRSKSVVDYDYFQSLFIQELWNHNTKKYDHTLLTLWGILDMKSYIDYMLGNTFNMYFGNSYKRIPINKLEDYNYMHEDTRKLNLLDIKTIKHFVLENINLKILYLATFEISDADNYFRPYVLLFTKNENDQFIEIGYGYDSNNDETIELFIQSFNYPVFLSSKGVILLPLSNKKIKLDVYDYITDNDIKKIMGSSD